MIVVMPAVFAINNLPRIFLRLGDKFPFRRDQQAVSGFYNLFGGIRPDQELWIGEVIFNLCQRSLPTIGILCLVDAFDDGAMYVILVDVERLNFTNDSPIFNSTSENL